MVQAKPAIPGMTPGAIVPQSDQDVEPGFTPTQLPSAGPPVANVQAKPTVHGTEDDRAGLSNWAPELNRLYDTKTGQPVRIDVSKPEGFQSIHQKLIAGEVGFKKGESVPMVSQNGESWNIPAENVVAAINSGYRLEHPKEIAVREFRAENAGLSGSAKAFLTNFADEALFGVPGVVYAHESTDLEKAKLQALKNDHAIANATGGIAGFGASMLYGGELFQTASKGGRLAERVVLGAAEKAAVREGEELAVKTVVNEAVKQGVEKAVAEKMAPGLVRQTAANMAKWGVEGAIINAPREITEAYYDPKAAAEHTFYTIGAGAALGAVTGPLGGKFIGLSKDLSKTFPEVFEQLRPGNLATRAAGAERGTARKMGGPEVLNNYGKILLGEGEVTPVILSDGKPVITGPVTRKTLEERVGMLKKESGEEIGSILEQLEKKSSPMTTEEILSSGKPGTPDNFPQASAYRPDVTEMINKLKAYREEFMDRIKTTVERNGQEVEEWINVVKPIYKKEVKEIDRILANVENKSMKEGAEPYFEVKAPGQIVEGRTINFKDAQELKQEIGTLANWDHTAKGRINEVRQQAYGIVRSELDKAVEAVSEKIDPTLAAAYKQAKLNYAAAEDVGKLLANANARDSNKIFGLTDTIIGGTVGAGSIAASIMSGNFLPMIFPLLSVTGKKVLETTWFQTGLASLLHNKSLNKAGLLFSEQAMKYGAQQLDKLPEVIQNSVKKVTPSTFTMSAVSRFIGRPEPKTAAEKQQMFKDLSGKLTALTLSPDKTAEQLANISAPLTFGAPKISQAYIQQTMKTYAYLASILPNANKDLNPFKKNISQLSDKEMADFERALRVVENPWYILEALQTNTVTQGQVDVLRNIYPSIYSAIQQKISEFAYSGKASELPYDTRLKLSLLMGIKLDKSIQDVSAFQQNFAPAGAKPPAGSKVDIISPKMNPYQTPIQKLMTR